MGTQRKTDGIVSSSSDERVHRLIQGWSRQYEETGELDPELRDLLRELVCEEMRRGD